MGLKSLPIKIKRGLAVSQAKPGVAVPAPGPTSPRPSVSQPVAPPGRPPPKPAPPPQPVMTVPAELVPQVPVDQPFDTPVLPLKKKLLVLEELDRTQVKGCTKCGLHQYRTHTVYGEGDPMARIMFIGEGPGENEDLQGRPFVGRAGQLLDKMIQGMGLSRDQVYIANVVKCRPPENRQPAPDEAYTCMPYLMTQIETVRPQAIVTLGLTATKFLLQKNLSMSKMRGQWHDWRGLKVMPTYHPAYVLRDYSPQTRAAVWSDLKQVLGLLGLPVPARKKSE